MVFKSSNWSLYSKSLNILPARMRHKLFFITFFQSLASLLDLLGLIALSSLTQLVSKGDLPGYVTKLIPYLAGNLSGGMTGVRTKEILVIVIISSFLLRTAISIHLTRKTLWILSTVAADLTTNLAGELLRSESKISKGKSHQEWIYLLTFGVEVICMRVIAAIFAIIPDFILLLVLVIGLVSTDIKTAPIVILFFAIVVVVFHRLVSRKITVLGSDNSKNAILSNQKISEIIRTSKEIKLRGTEKYFLQEIYSLRMKFANSLSELTFIPFVSKYLIETLVIVGSAGLILLETIVNPGINPVAKFTIFIAAGSRSIPAVLRIQQGIMNVKSNLGIANPTLTFFDEITEFDNGILRSRKMEDCIEEFQPCIELLNVGFRYEDESDFVVDNFSLRLSEGDYLGIMGPSGCGKSTLLNLILGIDTPQVGEILISGVAPNIAFTKWPGLIGYVPQSVPIIDGSIRENLLLGLNPLTISDSDMDYACKFARIDSFMEENGLSLDSPLFEFGQNLSGGQIQRIGIGRALLTRPRILILDEPTSALDATTEKEIVSAIKKIQTNTTILAVSHRFSALEGVTTLINLDFSRQNPETTGENSLSSTPPA
jgi:ABC-type bacteriocin/lantibiotic exporter with double-glycine peptidase domain